MQNICNMDRNHDSFYNHLQLPLVLPRIIDEKAFRKAPYQQGKILTERPKRCIIC